MDGNKLTSRKFCLALGGSATGLASIVSGIVVPDETAMMVLTVVGAVLMGVSVVAYNFAEAYVDAKSAMAGRGPTVDGGFAACGLAPNVADRSADDAVLSEVAG